MHPNASARLRTELSLLPDILLNPSSNFGGINVHDQLSSYPMPSNTTCSSGGDLVIAGTNQKAEQHGNRRCFAYARCRITCARRHIRFWDPRCISTDIRDLRRGLSRVQDLLRRSLPLLALTRRVWPHMVIRVGEGRCQLHQPHQPRRICRLDLVRHLLDPVQIMLLWPLLLHLLHHCDIHMLHASSKVLLNLKHTLMELCAGVCFLILQQRSQLLLMMLLRTRIGFPQWMQNIRH